MVANLSCHPCMSQISSDNDGGGCLASTNVVFSFFSLKQGVPRFAGDWILLQNCHLAKSWMPELEHIVTDLPSLSEADLHPEFRLWLSSMPVPYFPVAVLQQSVTVVIEPPQVRHGICSMSGHAEVDTCSTAVKHAT